jgi:hypothetical protein
MAILLLLALGVLCIVLLLRKYGAREPGLPPGPPTLPVLGNLHLLPTKYAHYKWVAHPRASAHYLPFISRQIHRMGTDIRRRVLGKDIIILPFIANSLMRL